MTWSVKTCYTGTTMNPLNFRNCVNFRDLGGYRTTDGRRVKSGMLYRSGGLYLLNEEELDRFRALRISFILDLRSRGEVAQKPDPVFEGVRLLQHSGLEHKSGNEIDFSPAGMARTGLEGRDQLNRFLGYYAELPIENESFRILLHEMNNLSAPILFHCASGKDRTGVAAMLVLYLLGVDADTILADYLLSNDFLKEDVEAELKVRAEIIARDPVAEVLSRMKCGVTEQAGRIALNVILSQHPDPFTFFAKEYDLDEACVSRIRDFYLEASV